MIRGIPFAPQQLSDSEVEQSWRQVQQRLPSPAVSRPFFQRGWFRAAAAVAILLIGTLLWWQWVDQPPHSDYVTAYGETREYVLPDGSEVTLNAHSHLTYQATTHPPRREVYLEGEAFFSVVHQTDQLPIPFVVHTPDLAVRVLGTEFNVNTRRGRTQVVLDDGSVTLQLPTNQTALMQPGELAEYQADQTQVRKETVNTQLFTVWRDRKLKFDDTPLSEVALLLEENYGVTVTFADPQLRKKRVTGEISARKLDIILRALSKLFNLSIRRSENIVHITSSYVTP